MKAILLICVAAITTTNTTYAAGIASCTEECQYFDSFNSSCSYATSCAVQNNCYAQTSCQRYDSFNQNCIAETTSFSCTRPGHPNALPNCVERCQYFDSFNQQCLYMTKCNYTNNCLTQTTCQHWDSFSQNCNYERTQYSCNILP